MQNVLNSTVISGGAQFIKWVHSECRPEVENLTQNDINRIIYLLYKRSPRKAHFVNSPIHPDYSDNLKVDDLVKITEDLHRTFKPLVMSEAELSNWSQINKGLYENIQCLSKIKYDEYVKRVTEGQKAVYDTYMQQMKDGSPDPIDVLGKNTEDDEEYNRYMESRTKNLGQRTVPESMDSGKKEKPVDHTDSMKDKKKNG